MSEKYIGQARYEAGPNLGTSLDVLPACLMPTDSVVIEACSSRFATEVERLHAGLEPLRR